MAANGRLPNRRQTPITRAVVQQQTLRDAVRFTGVGLHSGNRVTMAFLPAAPNTGIRFRRTDLDGQPELEARVEYVIDTTRSTSLGKGNVRIHTVEHVLATLAGFGIDNAVVELDSNEPPVTDGSAREFSRMVESAGIVPQGEARETVSVSEPIELQCGETFMAVFPHDRLKLTCTSTDRGGRYTQFRSLEVTPESWKRDLAPARTFCFFEEIEALIRNGLIKGGSLENAVVIRDDAVLTTEPLRFPDEFVRHKLLDVLGDLSLLGRPLAGHVLAVRPSHAANCELVRQIGSQLQHAWNIARAFAPPAPAAAATPAANAAPPHPGAEPITEGAMLDIDHLMRILPHRPPFLMVDRIVRIEGNRITGLKNVTINEPYFAGHFPGHPILPGVLQLEAMAQVAGILMLRQASSAGKLAYFMSAESVKWRKPVRPGDTLTIDVEITKSRGKVGRAKGTCSVDGDMVSEAEVTFMILEPTES